MTSKAAHLTTFLQLFTCCFSYVRVNTTKTSEVQCAPLAHQPTFSPTQSYRHLASSDPLFQREEASFFDLIHSCPFFDKTTRKLPYVLTTFLQPVKSVISGLSFLTSKTWELPRLTSDQLTLIISARVERLLAAFAIGGVRGYA